MKRPLMYAAGGFVLGEVCLLLPVWPGTGIPVILSTGVCCLWIWSRIGNESDGMSGGHVADVSGGRRKKESGRSLLWWILPLFCVLGMLRGQADERQWMRCQQVIDLAGKAQVRLEGDVWQVEEGEKSVVLKLRHVEVYVEGKGYEFRDVLVYVDGTQVQGLPEKTEEEKTGGLQSARLRNGMRIAAWGRLGGFEKASNPGQFDFNSYYRSLGFGGRMYGDYVRIVDSNYSPYYHFIAWLKQQSAEILKKLCTETDLGIFQAVLLGDKGQLQDHMRELYQRNGIAHLLAVSGLHISMIGLGSYHLLRKTGLGFDGAGFTAALITVSYGVLTGGAASVVRATAMVLFQIAADKLGRTYDLLSAMAFATIMLLLKSPTLLYQAGFQLSFGAILAIGAVNPVVVKWLRAERRWEKTVVLSLTIQLVTYPMLVYHFYEYPVYGIFLNLLVIPLMNYVVVSGLAGVGIGAFWLPGGEFAIGTGHYVLAAYQWLCRRFQQLPGAVWIVGRPENWQLVTYVVVWSGILIVVRWSSGRKLPAGPWKEGEDEEGRLGDRLRVIFACRRLVFLMMIVFGFISLRSHPPAGLEAAFLDVGQGDGIVLQTKAMVILVDGGSSDKKQLGRQILEPFLKSRGISRIDYAIVSHADQDHISGLTYLLESGQIPIGNLVLPWRGKEDEACGKLGELAKDVGTACRWMKTGDVIRSEGMAVRCLYAGENLSSRERNDHSLFLEVAFGSGTILLPGDMSGEGEQQWLAMLQETWPQDGKRILKAAHHGSQYSSSAEFLEKIQPDVTIISCGEGNSYGHPHGDTLERLEAVGSKVLTTKDWGAVIVELGEMLRIYGF